MKFVRNLEGFFEKYIEGFFNRKFSSGLQPVEIAKQLIREMENGRTVGVSHVYVPNSYQVHINPGNYEHLAPYSQAIQEELSDYLQREASDKGYTIIGKPQVELSLDHDIGEEQFQIASKFTEPIPEDKAEAAENAGSQELSDTRIFTKISMATTNLHNRTSGLLTVVDGADIGLKLDIGFDRVNIGRRESNEFPLSDLNTSRLHAYIAYEDKAHVLYDAKSLNGTYINGHRITRKTLNNGDRIKLGNTIILYEVR